MPSSSVRGAIWDMDGTMIDSTEYHWQSWREALAAENYKLTYEQFVETYGQRNDLILRSYLGDDLSTSEITRISDAKESSYRQMVCEKGIELLPGVKYWLDYLKANYWKQAIASSAPRANLSTIVEVLEIAHYFGAVVSAEDVEDGKPSPQVFLEAAAQIDVPPERCVVFEDSPSGVEAGKRGGMYTVGVLTSQESLDADCVVASLEELPRGFF
jgi:beta-phosphoglucomutase